MSTQVAVFAAFFIPLIVLTLVFSAVFDSPALGVGPALIIAVALAASFHRSRRSRQP